LRLEINKRDDVIRRLEFEVEKTTKMMGQAAATTSLSLEGLENLKLDDKSIKPLMSALSN
jgi:hypothetical protein